MSVRRTGVVPGAIALLLVSVSSPAAQCPLGAGQTGTGSLAAGVGPAPGLPQNYTRAQTFIAETNGFLDEVEVYLSPSSSVLQGALVADVRPAGALGAPLGDSTVLGTVTLQEVGSNGARTLLDFRSHNIPVQTGQRLAVVLSSAVDHMWWYGQSTDPYSGGDSYWRTDLSPTPWQHSVGSDLYFQVWICEAPTPVQETSWGRVKALYAD
jgi:hypothetical protein